MKGKVSAICPNCKYCEGMVEDSFYICGVTHSDGGLYHLMGVEDELYCTAYEEEINMNKVEGKVSDFCPKCKNCKGVTNEYDGKTASIRLTEVECEDPYDGMIKTLAADSDICCSMFEPNSPCDKISLLQHELEMDKLRMKIHQLEKEKAAHLKGIERLKKRVADSDYYKEKSELLEEKYIARGKDIDHLLSENKEKDKKISELESSCTEKHAEISKLQNIVTEKEVEIRGLRKDNVYLNQNKLFGDEAMKKNNKLRQTISDQEITIKALLITIKEMCKEDETDE